MSAPNIGTIDRNEYSEVGAAIAAHEFYSVDIFDTLLYRLCRSPIDVFRFMEQRADVVQATRHFTDYRVAAEQLARDDAKDRGAEDVSLSEIYDCFQELSDCTSEQATTVQQIELETERMLLQPTNFGRRFLSHVQQTGKRFVLTSDMYLPRAFLEDVLIDKGIEGWEYLFVSNEQGRTKHTGTLFEDVVAHFGVDSAKILHIGDNKHGDGRMALKAGLESYLVPASKDLAARSRIARKRSHLFNGTRPLSQVFAAHYFEKHHFEADRLDFRQLSDDAYFEAVGAVLVAPVMMSMMFWLKAGMEKRGMHRVAFLARDGMFPKAAFDLLWPDGFETQYVAASRRVLTLPFSQLDERLIHGMFLSTLKGCADLDDFLKAIAAGAKLRGLFESSGIDLNKKFTTKRRERVLEILKNNPEAVYWSFENERESVSRYYRSVFPPASRTAVFDVGWRGSLQRSICEIVGKEVDITGFYFGTERSANQVLRRKNLSFESFAVNLQLPKSREAWVTEFRYVVEFLFSADHGGVLQLSEKGGGEFSWLMADVGALERRNMDIAGKIQSAALAAIAEVKGAIPLGSLEKITSEHDEDDLYNFLSKPHRQDAMRFKPVRVFSGIGDTTGESLTRIGVRGSHYRNVKISRWRRAYGAHISSFARTWVNFRLGQRKYKNLRI